MKRIIFAALVVLSLALSSLVACSSAPSQKSTEATRPQAPSALPGGMTKEGIADGDARNGAGQIAPLDRMIVYTANLSLVVKDVARGMDSVTDIVALAGGVVAGTRVETDPSQKDKEDLRIVSMTLRVPATSYQDVMSKLRKLAIKPPDENSSSQDVTEEFSDLRAQLRNLEVVEAQYQELMKKAVTIDEILKVQQRLGETRGQIERVKGRMIYLERRADMATITLLLRPEVPGKAKPQPWDPIRVASEAWEASMAFLQAVATVMITVAVFFWWILPFAILAIVLWQVWRGRRRPAVTTGA